MPYASILVHLDVTPHCTQRVAYAARVAIANNAHLIGLAATGTLHLPSEVSQALGREYLDSRQAQMQEEARRSYGRVRGAGERRRRQLVRRPRRDGSYENALMVNGRYSDLVVLARPE